MIYLYCYNFLAPGSCKVSQPLAVAATEQLWGVPADHSVWAAAGFPPPPSGWGLGAARAGLAGNSSPRAENVREVNGSYRFHDLCDIIVALFITYTKLTQSFSNRVWILCSNKLTI